MDLVTIDHLLTTTRSVRKRLDLRRAVDPHVIQQGIEIAIQAPNGGNRGLYHCSAAPPGLLSAIPAALPGQRGAAWPPVPQA